jgi:hypothetical protein
MRNKLIGVMLLSACVYAQRFKPAVHFVFDSNLLVASGRWISSDPKVKAAYPSEVEIDCVLTTKTCTEATAEYYSGHPHVSLTYLPRTYSRQMGRLREEESRAVPPRLLRSLIGTVELSDVTETR